MKKKKFCLAFTLAETLIVIIVIGIVATLTIPTLISSYKDKVYNTARLKALKTFGEAGKMASANSEINGQPTARDFAQNVLSKYLKIIKVCSSASECSFPTNFKASNSATSLRADYYTSWSRLLYQPYTLNNWTNTGNDNLSTYIQTADGFSAKIYYNPKCIANSHDGPYSCNSKICNTNAVDATCMNVLYDMNGLKGPNHVGEDIGIVTTFWSGINSVSVAPGIIPYEKNNGNPGNKSPQAIQYCEQKSTGNVKYYLPTIDELSSLVLNLYFVSITTRYYVSSSPEGRYYWFISGNGGRAVNTGNNTYNVWCIRR